MNFHSFSSFLVGWGNLTPDCYRWHEPMFCIHLKHTKLKHKTLWNPSEPAAVFFLIFSIFLLYLQRLSAKTIPGTMGLSGPARPQKSFLSLLPFAFSLLSVFSISCFACFLFPSSLVLFVNARYKVVHITCSNFSFSSSPSFFLSAQICFNRV